MAEEKRQFEKSRAILFMTQLSQLDINRGDLFYYYFALKLGKRVLLNRRRDDEGVSFQVSDLSNGIGEKFATFWLVKTF